MGLEIFKALLLANKYILIGGDASNLSYGLYVNGLKKAFILPRATNPDYTKEILKICKKYKVRAIAPGSEAELRRISTDREQFQNQGVLPMINAPEVIEMCGNKAELFRFLQQRNIRVPKTIVATSPDDIDSFDSYQLTSLT